MPGRFTLRERSSGVLLHLTSLPGPHGAGDLGPGAHGFADFLAAARQGWWQMLPIGPTGYGDSPYQSLSAHAGNPLLIALEPLAEAGWLAPVDAAGEEHLAGDRVDFVAARRHREPRLRRACAAFERDAGAAGRAGFEAFCAANAGWLEDFALFSALRAAHGERSWTDWEADLRARVPAALDHARERLAAELQYQRFLQYVFDRQWRALRAACAARGIGLMGDVPIFLAHDSVDVWAHQDLFHLDGDGRPTVVAGVPPDYFSRTGQLWGNPLYRWDVLKARGYDWWIERLRTAFVRFDAVRLDHFIGFHRYWEVPATETTATRGVWRPGPGDDFFNQVLHALGPIELIAEDLGSVTPEVLALRDRFGLPGMRVLHFCFGADPGVDGGRPLSFARRSVVYTGTHDNDTTVGWFRDRGTASTTRTQEEIERERAGVLRCLGTDGHEIHWDLIRLALRSAADTAIVPVQDLLGLGSEARMNRPGAPEGNWAWRLRAGQLGMALAARLAALTEGTGRARVGAEPRA